MDEIKAKQQVVEKIKESTKILVTVSDNPSVDALSAALALTMLLDKQEKYATSIFSGETPPAIAFLEPEKTFDDTTDSLRDFIIALNKEKADHLRYKVEGDAVKIFITPYKTVINENDLEFSQGDYNVELVIALGVDERIHLDKALENHGQILHDASIVTMTAGDQTSDLGGTDWHDSNSSSLSEMVAGLAEAMKEDKKKPLLDEQIATALLTGIVAETDRFSNEHTTSKSLTVAANLMAAGADQQLVANELQAARKIDITTPEEESSDEEPEVEVEKDSNDGSMIIHKDNDDKDENGDDEDSESNGSGDSINISHEGETLADLDRRVRGEDKAREKVTEEVEAVQEEAKEAEAEEAAREALEKAQAAHAQVNDVKAVVVDDEEDEAVEPVLGGTLNATTEQAADDARRAAENDQNRTILSHSYLAGSETSAPVTPGSTGVNEAPTPTEAVHSAYAPVEDPLASATPAPSDTPAVGGERVIQPLDTPHPAPQPLFEPAPEPAPAPNPTPTDLGLPLPPPLPDFSQLGATGGAPAPAIPLPPSPQPEILGDILAPEPVLDNTANAIPAPNTAYALDTTPVAPVDPSVPPLPPLSPSVTPPVAPAVPEPYVQPLPPQAPAAPQNTPADPGQFQIPAQP